MKYDFKYPVGKTEIKMSARAFRAGERALGRPADLDERPTPKAKKKTAAKKKVA